MNLLKGDGTSPSRSIKVLLVWPQERLPSDILIRIGFWISLGGGIALTVVLPILLLIFGCIIALGITIKDRIVG